MRLETRTIEKINKFQICYLTRTIKLSDLQARMKWKKEGWHNYQYQEGKISFLVSAEPADTKKIIRKHHKELYKQMWQFWQNGSVSPKLPESLSQPQEELWSWNGSWISPTSISHWMWAASGRTWPWVMCLCSEAIYEATEACPDASPRNWAKSFLEGIWPAILLCPTVWPLCHSDLPSQ